ncbi:hypothetical protein ASPVEDRAFT_140900 [Aspergillus versicolor CBS 583.65]|uniref:F-box domain-containing protein n=1 Tax=Aspergillus versicolor CBS 583.65 TaxID=1036611 RepID=A0A1L9PYH6_ASPVE|nr:uncharacterized protein ASPVEDRAFT_140900 [Aspergillus versicolor CBS 583.65]OJJ06492.1 hypothetical protein ASPVEDRAFT_140900 [Aspergillus versicolor CBS 583.65]
MTQFLSLPIEILHRICYYADLSSRKGLRLMNRRLGDVAARWVFHTISVSPLEASCDRLQNILQRPDVASYVMKLYLVTFDLEEDGNCVDTESQDCHEETEVPRRFWDLFDQIKDFPRLQSVALCFHWEHSNGEWVTPQPTETFRSPVMERVFAALAAMPQKVNELAIQDLHNANETDPTVVADIKQVLGGIQSLRLNIVNELWDDPPSDTYKKKEAQAFPRQLPGFWLRPAMSNLRHLTLYSDLRWGFYPILDFTGIHFPQLETLALGHYAFADNSQLQWILSHAATLTELYLDDCSILYAMAREWDETETLLPHDRFTYRNEEHRELWALYDGRWADYFRAFKHELPRLQHFRYGRLMNIRNSERTPFEKETDMEVALHEESYQAFFEERESNQYASEANCEEWEVEQDGIPPWPPASQWEEDRQALGELCAKLGQTLLKDSKQKDSEEKDGE